MMDEARKGKFLFFRLEESRVPVCLSGQILDYLFFCVRKRLGRFWLIDTREIIASRRRKRREEEREN